MRYLRLAAMAAILIACALASERSAQARNVTCMPTGSSCVSGQLRYSWQCYWELHELDECGVLELQFETTCQGELGSFDFQCEDDWRLGGSVIGTATCTDIPGGPC